MSLGYPDQRRASRRNATASKRCNVLQIKTPTFQPFRNILGNYRVGSYHVTPHSTTWYSALANVQTTVPLGAVDRPLYNIQFVYFNHILQSNLCTRAPNLPHHLCEPATYLVQLPDGVCSRCWARTSQVATECCGKHSFSAILRCL